MSITKLLFLISILAFDSFGSQLESFIQCWDSIYEYKEVGTVSSRGAGSQNSQLVYRYRITMLVGISYCVEIQQSDGEYKIVNFVEKNGDSYLVRGGANGREQIAKTIAEISPGYTGSGWAPVWMFGGQLCFKEKEYLTHHLHEKEPVSGGAKVFSIIDQSRYGWTAELGVDSPVIVSIIWKPLGGEVDERIAEAASWIKKDGSIGTWKRMP